MRGLSRWWCVLLAGVPVLTCVGGVQSMFQIAGQQLPEGGAACPAYDGSRALVGIESGETNKLYLQFIDPEEGLSGDRIDLGLYGNTPLIGFEYGNYLVAWNNGTQVFGQLVQTNGVAIGSTFQISNSPGYAGLSELTRMPAAGGRFLVVWEDERSPGDSDIYGQIVQANGVLAGSEIAIAADHAGTGLDDSNVSVATDGTNFLAVFSAERRGDLYDGEDVYGQFVSTGGMLMGGNFVIDQNDLPSSNPTAACWDGEKFTVLFHDAIPVGLEDEQWDVYARFVSPLGEVATNRIAIAASPFESEMFPTLAFDGDRYMVTLTSFTTPSNGVAKARFYDQHLEPLTPWFMLAPLSAPAVPVSSVVSAGNGRFLAGTSYINWIPSDEGDGDEAMFVRTDGVVVSPNAPECIGGGIDGTSVSLAYGELFPGTTNHLQRTGSLASGGWTNMETFYCTSSSTNLSGVVDAEWPGQFFRLLME